MYATTTDDVACTAVVSVASEVFYEPSGDCFCAVLVFLDTWVGCLNHLVA